MKYRWLNKNIDISSIEDAAKAFLELKGFKTFVAEDRHLKKIVGVARNEEGPKKVIVSIEGSSIDFAVDFLASETSQLMSRFSPVLNFLGGGALTLRGLKQKEFYEKIENEFWTYLEEFIAMKSYR